MFTRKLPCLTIQDSLHSQTPTTWDFHCWDQSPFAAASSNKLTAALLDSLQTPLSYSQTRPLYLLGCRFPIAVSDICILKIIWSDTDRKSQLELGAEEEGSWTKQSLSFYTFIPWFSGVFLLSHRLPHVSLWPVTWLAPSPHALCCVGVQCQVTAYCLGLLLFPAIQSTICSLQDSCPLSYLH